MRNLRRICSSFRNKAQYSYNNTPQSLCKYDSLLDMVSPPVLPRHSSHRANQSSVNLPNCSNTNKLARFFSAAKHALTSSISSLVSSDTNYQSTTPSFSSPTNTVIKRKNPCDSDNLNTSVQHTNKRKRTIAQNKHTNTDDDITWNKHTDIIKEETSNLLLTYDDMKQKVDLFFAGNTTIDRIPPYTLNDFDQNTTYRTFIIQHALNFAKMNRIGTSPVIKEIFDKAPPDKKPTQHIGSAIRNIPSIMGFRLIFGGRKEPCKANKTLRHLYNNNHISEEEFNEVLKPFLTFLTTQLFETEYNRVIDIDRFLDKNMTTLLRSAEQRFEDNGIYSEEGIKDKPTEVQITAIQGYNYDLACICHSYIKGFKSSVIDRSAKSTFRLTPEQDPKIAWTTTPKYYI